MDTVELPGCGIEMPAQSGARGADWCEEYAYTLGVQAYIFGFPWLYLAELRWRWISEQFGDPTDAVPLNRLWHARELVNAAYRDGSSPSNDTLYSVAWLELAQEPLVLSVPAMADRYYTLQIAAMDSDNVDYVGTRATGRDAGNYLIAGPGWRGSPPQGVTALVPSRTNSALILGRTWVDGGEDLPAVRAAQDGYRLTPLSLWTEPNAPRPRRLDVWRPLDPSWDAIAEWQTMNRAMTENPPEDRHSTLLKLFATIGIGPGQRVELTPLATRRGLARAARTARELLGKAAASGTLGRSVNGWAYPPRTVGRAGLCDDFLTRGGPQCLSCIIANDPAESMILNLVSDGCGAPLTGDSRYSLRFEPGGLPPVDACWSISMYGEDYNFVPNPMGRFAIGSRTPGLRHDDDGGLTLHLQREQPAAEQESNWLPAPPGRFALTLRAYVPRSGLIEQRWEPPCLERAA